MRGLASRTSIAIGLLSMRPATTVVAGTQYGTFDDSLSTIVSGTTYTDGTTSFRFRIVGNDLYLDITLTATGFSGSEDTDWENLHVYNGQDPVWRYGSDTTAFVLDCEITGTGFSGSEDTDWERIYETAHPTSVQTAFRIGVRSAAVVIDQALTATGFSGSEDTDWVELVNWASGA